MRLPEKKCLVLPDRPAESDHRAKKSVTKKRLEPIHLLNQFQN